MSAGRILKMPHPKAASGVPRRLRRFVPPKFQCRLGGWIRVLFRGHYIGIGPRLEEDGPGWVVYHHTPGPKPDGYSAKDTIYRPGCTRGGAAVFPTKNEAIAAVLASCRAIHDGVEIIALPLRQTTEDRIAALRTEHRRLRRKALAVEANGYVIIMLWKAEDEINSGRIEHAERRLQELREWLNADEPTPPG